MINKKTIVSKLMKTGKVGGVLTLSSLIIAIPITISTLPQSMRVAADIYRGVSMLLHTNSPAQTIPDENGIPVVDYGYRDQTYVGEQINPLMVAGTAIGHYNKLKKSGDRLYRTYFENCINWLDDSKIDTGKCYLWAYNFPSSGYDTLPPYYSALAQGRIMLAFAHAYQLTGEERYLELASKAMLSLDTPIEEGGVMYQGPGSAGKWFAELASPKRDKPPFILNGHMYVLLYLQDFYNLTGVQQAQTLFQEGVAELKVRLHDYDTGYWTYYDREGNIAYDYHYVHIEQLQRLYQLTDDETIKEYHDKWASYFPFNPLWARKRFAAYLFDAAAIFLVLVASYLTYKLVKVLKFRTRGTELLHP